MPYLKYFVPVYASLLSFAVWAQVAPPDKIADIGASSAAIQPGPQTQPPAQAPPAAQPAVGRVFAVTGEWARENGQLLVLGSPVAAGEKIAVKSAGKSTVSIILTSGTVLERTCPGAPDCTAVIIPQSKSTISDNFERILNGTDKIPANLKITSLGGDTTPVPTVLMYDGTLLRFGPVVMDLPSGSYDLQFLRRKDGLLDPAPDAKIQFPWSTRDPTYDEVAKMENGIYRFTILRGNKQVAPSVDVLILDRREYTRLRPYFEEARQISNSWSISDSAIRTFQVFSLYGINANRRQ